jgi:hypothetical protein
MEQGLHVPSTRLMFLGVCLLLSGEHDSRLRDLGMFLTAVAAVMQGGGATAWAVVVVLAVPWPDRRNGAWGWVSECGLRGCLLVGASGLGALLSFGG